jgi:hypothetical protein
MKNPGFTFTVGILPNAPVTVTPEVSTAVAGADGAGVDGAAVSDVPGVAVGDGLAQDATARVNGMIAAIRTHRALDTRFSYVKRRPEGWFRLLLNWWV